jgi:hypothetical protein
MRAQGENVLGGEEVTRRAGELRYHQHRIMSYPKETKALLALKYCH